MSFSLGDAREPEMTLQPAGFRRIQVTAHTLDIGLRSPEHFVHLTITAAATSVPAFIHMSPQARSQLVEAIADELGPMMNRYSASGELSFPMSTHIALAA